MELTLERNNSQDSLLVDTREGNFRYAGYLARAKKQILLRIGKIAQAAKSANTLKTIAVLKKNTATATKAVAQSAKGASRYVAYSSDVGEALRPVVHNYWVMGAYAMAITYVGVDIAVHGQQAKKKGKSVPRAVLHAAAFQSLASLTVPSLVIHTTVSTAGRLVQNRARLVTWVPSVAGLMMIPVLPVIDKPLETAVDWSFDKVWRVEDKEGADGANKIKAA